MICTDKTKAPLLDDNTIKEVVKHRRPKRSEEMQVQTEPGENSKYIRHSLVLMNMKPPDMSNAESVMQHISNYFTVCEENDMKPSVEGLALSFGVDRRTVWRWANGVECSHLSEEVRHTIKRAYSLLNNLMVEYMQNGKINPVSGIFLMKNNMGYADQSEIVITPNSPLGSESNPESVTQKYAELPTE